MTNLTWLLFDWGDTLMFDNPHKKGEMYLWDEIELMDGVSETLPQLSKKYNCAVVSNASDSTAITMKKAFERMGIDHYFKLFITSKEIGYKKPDDRFFKHIANKLSTPFEQLCMVGNDYEKDIVTPFNLGMKTILISSNLGEYPKAGLVLDGFERLKEVLL